MPLLLYKSHIIAHATHSLFCHAHLWEGSGSLCVSSKWAAEESSELPSSAAPLLAGSFPTSPCLSCDIVPTHPGAPHCTCSSGNVFLILGSPELDPVLQVWSHWEGAEMKDHCPGCWEAYFNKTNDPLTKSSHIIPTDPAVQNILVLALLPSVHSCFSIP